MHPYVAIYDANNFAGTVKNISSDSGNNGPFYYLKKGEKFDLLNRKALIEKTAAKQAASN